MSATSDVLEPARPEAGEVERALERLRPWYEGLGLDLPAPPDAFAPDFEAQFAALVRAAPPVASFTFGCLTPQQVGALHARGVYVVGTATSVPEARAWAAALALGAVAAQMGTAFLLADEAATSAPWRAAVEAAGEHSTRLTRAFSGRWARGVENRFMREMAEGEIPAYPVQNRLTQPLRAAAAKAGDAEALSLWAGQGVALTEPGKSADLIRRWWADARAAAAAASRRTGL